MTGPFLAMCIAVGIAVKVVNVLKGKWWLALFGGGIFDIGGAILIAKPGSWWDRHLSSPEKRERSVKRFASRRHAKRVLP